MKIALIAFFIGGPYRNSYRASLDYDAFSSVVPYRLTYARSASEPGFEPEDLHEKRQSKTVFFRGGPYRTRTCHLLGANEALYQMS